MEIGLIINAIVLILLLLDLKLTKYISKDDAYEVKNSSGRRIVTNSQIPYKEVWHRIKLPLWFYIFLIFVSCIPYVGTICSIFGYLLYDTCKSYDYYYEIPFFHQKLVNIVNKFVKVITTKI